MRRYYQNVIEDHFKHYQQMAFVTGPRQVGKTTISQNICAEVPFSKYLNWDQLVDRQILLTGVEAIIQDLPINAAVTQKPIIIIDEIHKYKNWKNFLKGFIDEFKGKLDLVITGSAKLNIIRRGGDSLMGRYFLYRVHPLSVRELLSTDLITTEIQLPKEIDDARFNTLFEFGGFPEPFLQHSAQFSNRWQLLRQEQMFKEDIKNSENIQDLSQFELLGELIKHQAAQQMKYSELAKKVRAADTTIRRWIKLLESYYYCFSIKPFTANISRSLIKEPKIYLWDWSQVLDKGAKIENFVASHLLKAVQAWQDSGLGKYELFYIRDKEKKEVDFVITKNNAAWILIEVKSSAKEKLSEHLILFQQQTKAPFAFQLAYDLPYIDKDCFSYLQPMIVSLKTFLSQLI